MLTLEKVVELLQDRNASKVAEATGLHENTIRAIRAGKNDNPSSRTLAILSAYLEQGK